MTILAIVPTSRELATFDAALRQEGVRAITETVGTLAVTHFPELSVATALGGLGKAQFAAHTQHLIENGEWEIVVCAGAAGALVDDLSVGDVVIATETIEHDIRNRFGPPQLPRFETTITVLKQCRNLTLVDQNFTIHYAAIASGDEDVVDEARRAEVHARTNALAVAWEGAGGARACLLSGVPYVEIRGISDGSNNTAAKDFVANLPQVMRNVASVVVSLAGYNNQETHI
ncbi:MAG: 5'-methylthioadenosine/S-adenosylhomocysteine nucleosidase [Caldilineaceae bacterium]